MICWDFFSSAFDDLFDGSLALVQYLKSALV